MSPRVVYRFGAFTLDPASFRLRRDGEAVPLTPKSFEVLALLVRERHRGLSKQEIFDIVWRDTAVTENTLNQRIREIREALGDTAHDPAHIRTIPRIGFQFVAEVVEEQGGHTVAAEPEVKESADQSARKGARWPARSFILAACVLAVLVGTLAALLTGPPGATIEPPVDRRVMLAVLPFENMTGDPEQEYFSDGLTEEMIAELGRLDGQRLGVIARTSVMTFKRSSKSAAAIASELGADFILEGSVRREADQVRIVAQLIRASDQTHVWSEQYDRDVHSILALQREVAQAIATETRARLTWPAAATEGQRVDVHPDAYHAYLKGRYFLSKRTGESVLEAVRHFSRATEIAPAYAQAFAGLAEAHELSMTYAGVSPRQGMAPAMDAARRAVELDPNLSEPHTALAILHAAYTWEWDASEQAFRRALDLNANNAAAHKGYSELLSYLGRHDEAIVEAQRAIELDPLSLVHHTMLAATYHRARRYEASVRQARHALEMDSTFMLGHMMLGLSLVETGAYAEAIRALEQACALSPDYPDSLALLGYALARGGRTTDARRIAGDLDRLAVSRYVSPYVLAILRAGLGERDQALQALERAYADRTWAIAMLQVDPVWDSLRDDRRFVALLRQLNFPR